MFKKAPKESKIILPINYDLEFEPDLKNFTFAGKLSLSINCKSSTDKIILNAFELEIKSCIVKIKNESLESKKICLFPEKRELEVTLPKKIKGEVTINFEFTGILNDNLRGFYRSKYEEVGKTKYLATTQFEAQDACQAFPCWDHPSAKATFDITITTDSNFTAISNMPIKSKKSIGSKTIYQFEKTPVMSTYLVYLGVGEYGIKTKTTKGGVELRFISTPGNESKGEFALDLTEKLLPEYEDYFGIKYPLPKLDLIAIPDFDSSAMENWGAITFRESALYYDQQTSSTNTLLYIATTISHEIAHQWFGNLVTMKWWNDLWLNESFATYMAPKFVDKFYPEWDLWDQFIGDDTDEAMELDSLNSSHSIDVKVENPSEIDEIFDAISYQKGASILRMLEKYVGEKNFRSGLRSYLEKFKYKNATGDDLWNEIGRASDIQGVLDMVTFWIKQVGFPLVTIAKQNSNLFLKQERFLRLPRKEKKIVWPIPISIGLKEELSNKLMKTETDKIPLQQKPCIVNYGRNGFYRVKYDSYTLSALKPLIETKEILPIDRWAIEYDLFALCMSGNETVKNFLSFLDAYHEEDNYLPSMDIARNLNFLFSLTFYEDFKDEIRKYANNHLIKILQRLTWEPIDHEKNSHKLLRSYAIEFLGKMEDAEVVSEARKKFKQFLENPYSIVTDLLEPIFIVVAWNGGKNTHEELTSLYKQAKTQEEKDRFLKALSYFKDKNQILETLELSLSDAVRTQNIDIPINNIAKNPYGKKILWPWLKENWKKLTKKTGEGNYVIKRVIETVSEISDDSMIDEVKDFLKKNPTNGTEKTLSQALERAQINSKFLKRMRNEFS